MFSKRKSYSIGMLRIGRITTPEQYSERPDKSDSMSNQAVDQQTDLTEFKPFSGLAYMFLHATFNQLASVIIKNLPYINPSQLSLIRNAGLFIGILPITIYYTGQIFGEMKDRVNICLRGIFGATAVYLQIMAYSYLPLAEASIVLSTLPIVTTVLARILLKEPFGWIQSLTIFMAVCGVLLAFKIPKLFQNRNSVNFDSVYLSGLAASAGSVFLYSLAGVYIRKLKGTHFSIMNLYASVIGIIENTILNRLFFPFVPTYCGWDQILCILLGTIYFLSNCFVLISYQVQPAGQASVQKSSFDILVTIVFQILFFNVYPDFYLICGACFVIASLSILGIRSRILTMPESSKLRRKLKWIL